MQTLVRSYFNLTKLRLTRLPLILLSCLTLTATANATAAPRVTASQSKLPLEFEINRGQTDPQVKFLAHGPRYSLFLTSTEAVLSLAHAHPVENAAHRSPARASCLTQPATPPAALRLQLVGATAQPHITGEGQLAGISNYFIGQDAAKWQTNITHYARVRYAGVYRGIDLIYYGTQGQLEYDFVVAPGRNVNAIKLRWQGMQHLSINANGALVMQLKDGQVQQHIPHIYQSIDGQRQPVTGRYVLLKAKAHHTLTGGQTVGFRIGNYNHHYPLVIDPVLLYATYLGGAQDDNIGGIALDAANNMYVAGSTTSLNFPIKNSFQPTRPNNLSNGVAFVSKLNPAGTALIYSTYLGGSGGDGADAIALDATGNAYITGVTDSTDFPTLHAFQPNAPLSLNGFVAKLSASGAALLYSTYLGGDGYDTATGIAVNAAGDAYVVGSTESTNFPNLHPLQPRRITLIEDFILGDAFVTELNATGNGLIYSTDLGGTGDDEASGIALDQLGNAYVVGNTRSADFPLRNAAQTELKRDRINGAAGAVFISKLNPTGTALVYSTYLGGSQYNDGTAIAVDHAGNAYVTGRTQSPDFPLHNAYQSYQSRLNRLNTPFTACFVTKLNTTGNTFLYSTYLGNDSFGLSIAVDQDSNAYVAGNIIVPVTSAFPQKYALPSSRTAVRGTDGFIAKFNAAGTGLIYSTLLGIPKAQQVSTQLSITTSPTAVALDGSGNVYVAGYTLDPTLKTTSGAVQKALAGGVDGFIAKLSAQLVALVVNFTSPRPGGSFSSFPGVGGRVTEVPNVGTVSRVLLYIQRQSDHRYWTGAQWLPLPVALETSLTGNQWSYKGALPTGAELVSSTYTLTALAVESGGTRNTDSINIHIDAPK